MNPDWAKASWIVFDRFEKTCCDRLPTSLVAHSIDSWDSKTLEGNNELKRFTHRTMPFLN